MGVKVSVSSLNFLVLSIEEPFKIRTCLRGRAVQMPKPQIVTWGVRERVLRRAPRPDGPNAWPPGRWCEGESIAVLPGRTVQMFGPQIVIWEKGRRPSRYVT